MQADVIDSQIQLARNIAGNGGRILVVGARPDNVGQELWNHPRLVFYESKDSHGAETRDIPANVKLVLFTRFVSHPSQAAITKIANKRNIHCLPMLHSTGSLRKILEEARIVTPEDEPTPDAAPRIDYDTVQPHTPLELPPPGKVKGVNGAFYTEPFGQNNMGADKSPRGAVKLFVEEYAKHYYPHGLPKKMTNEAERLMREAHHIGLVHSTEASLLNALGAYRRDQRIREATVASMNVTPTSATGAEPATTIIEAVNPLDPTHPLTLDAITVIEDIMVNLELLKEKLLTDYARIDDLVKGRVREKLKAFMDTDS